MSSDLTKDLKALRVSADNNEAHYEREGVDKSFLEKFPNPFKVANPSKSSGIVRIEAPEVTSLCPLTKYPDFAKIVIEYTPDDYCVESKSLKLYLNSFRKQGEFHESCVNRICNDLVELLNPANIKVTGEFTPRGGIAFWPTAFWEQGM